MSRTCTHDVTRRRGFLEKTCVKGSWFDKSREGSSPYGRGLGILANDGVCLRPRQNMTKLAICRYIY